MDKLRRPSATFSGSLLTKALEKVREFSEVPVEVLVSRKKSTSSPEQLLARLWKRGLLSPKQIVIYANPDTRQAGVWIGPESSCSLQSSDWKQWIHALEEDLHQTHPDRALALAVMSLGLALNSLHQR